jgi:imidazolonepropionase-like amidohydrolase
MTPITRRTCLGGLGAILTSAAAGSARGQAKEITPVAVLGGKLLRPDDEPLDDAVVVMKGDRITYVGTDTGKAKGATQHDVSGSRITAGFVDLLTQVGVREVSLEKSTVDTAERTDDPIRAAFRTADGYDPMSTLVPIARRGGLTSVGVVPGPIPLAGEQTMGLVTGQSAWADLAGDVPDEAIARESLALHIHLDDASLGHYGHTRGTIMLRLRELFDDARAYEKNKAAYTKGQLRELGTSRLDYEVVVRALAGTLPTVVHVDRASDIVNVLALAKANGLKLVLASGAEGWRVAKRIAKADAPVILYGLDHGPRSFSARYAREDNAKRLHKAGVRVAISVGSAHMARKLPQVAGNAVRAGLPYRAALDAVTRAPAEMLGMTDYGAVAPKKIANVVVWSGDPFELSSRATHVFIRGEKQSLRTRQTALFERYKKLPRRPRK